MDNRYKIIISSNHIYKEIELPPDAAGIRVGTGVNCDVRLHRRLFFEAVELVFTREGDSWAVSCADNLYLTVGDVRKFLTINLRHGDCLEVKYQKSDTTAFRIDFLVDFYDGKRKYERAIDISGRGSVSIGSAASNEIFINSAYIFNDNIVLYRREDGLELCIHCTTYGIYHNGKLAKDRQLIASGDFFSLSDFFFYYKDGILWTEIRNDMLVRGLLVRDHPSNSDYPRFNRNSRVKIMVKDDKIEVLDPPAMPQKPKNNWLTRLLPSMGMLIAGALMAFMGGTMIIFSAISCGMAVVTTVINVRQGNKDYETGVADRYQKYTDYIARKRGEIEQARAEERSALEELYVAQPVEIDRLRVFSPDLFDRSPRDDDFLCVRLGSGAVKSRQEIQYKHQERLEIDDELQLIPQQLQKEYMYVGNAPIVCDLRQTNAVGIVGAEAYRFSFLKNMVIDLTARQFFSDVRLVFVAESWHKDQIYWLRMLPHVMNEQTGARNIVCDDESKNLVFEYLFKEMSFREQNKGYDHHIVVFFYDEYGFKNHPLSRFVDKAKDLGVAFVFFGERKADIPMGCGYLVDIRDHQVAALYNVEDRNDTVVFGYPTVSDRNAKEIVKLLAPVYTEEVSLEGSLTKNITLFDLLNILTVEDLDLDARWKKSVVWQTMSVPLGVSKTGVVYLDLHDKAHGPHGLVAGTTGSGKSEILQTYILSVATLFHPHEVAFLIIDFKGGGMVNQFKDLPHLLGAITNIDGKQINRSLKSIKAELQKRQRYFAEADVNHIDKYIKKYKAGEVSQPLPHLVIIVDEFAELKAEQPEFMKELISAARIGRSLGVHLILATQKPSGQVNEQIWSNSRFKLCLKVQSQQDSNEVLKSPLAAEIKEPGRAYLQVGNNEIFELFQTAYSGASEKADDSGITEFSIYQLTESGKRVPVFVQKKKKPGEESATQLDAIVRYVNAHCRENRIEKLPQICMAALDEVIDFREEGQTARGAGEVIADIGIYDDPDNQYQGAYSLSLTAQNLMVIGSSQSGKTNMLQTIIRSVAARYTPDEVSIYVIDFASRVLKNFESLRHVGGVVTPTEDEKLKNLFKLLHTEIEQRKEKLTAVGVSSFAAYREAGKTDLPQILLMIDNLTALKEMYFQDDDMLLGLCREGLSVGISIIIANAHTTGIGYKYLSNFAGRIAMFCNDSGEYSALFDHCGERPDPVPGRCVIELEKRHLECQTYLAFSGEKEIDRVKSIREFITRCNGKYAGSAARLIPVIPASLTEGYARDVLGNAMNQPFRLVAGLDYASVTPYVVDLSNLDVLAVSGRKGAGKHNFLCYTVHMLEQMYPGTTQVHIVDGVRRKLASLKAYPNVASYDFLADKAAELIKQTEQTLAVRYEAISSGDENALEREKLILLILNSMDAMEAVSADTAALKAYRNITGKYKNMRISVILGGYDNVNVAYGAPEVIKKAKDARHFIFFDDLTNMKITDLPMAVMRDFKKPIELGDGYYIKENKCVKIKTPLAMA